MAKASHTHKRDKEEIDLLDRLGLYILELLSLPFSLIFAELQNEEDRLEDMEFRGRNRSRFPFLRKLSLGRQPFWASGLWERRIWGQTNDGK